MADQQTSIEINFKEIILQMQSLDEIIVFRATQAARKIVQDKLPNEIETLVKCGIVPILVRFLYADKYVKIIFLSHFYHVNCFLFKN